MSEMKRISCLMFIIVFSIQASAQTDLDCQHCIVANRGFVTTYWKARTKLSASDMTYYLGQFPESKEAHRKSKGHSVVSVIFSAAGGVLIGYPLGMAIAGNKEPNWILAGVGAGLVGLSIPFTLEQKRYLRKAVDAYNTNVR